MVRKCCLIDIGSKRFEVVCNDARRLSLESAESLHDAHSENARPQAVMHVDAPCRHMVWRRLTVARRHHRE